MIPLFAPEQVRAMDQRAFSRGIAEAALMERAAGHLARAVRELAGRTYGLRVAVLAGRGNNGGDGFAAAARLADLGAAPAVASVHPPQALQGLPAAMLTRWRARGGRVTTDPAAALAGADVAVDCLLGTGARGAPREPEATAVEALAAFDGPVVACDLPSGVDALTGAVPGPAVQADVTCTLGAHKVGLWLPPAVWHVGRIVLGELDLPRDGDQPVARALQPADVAALLPPPRPDTHKRRRGVVTVVAGSPGMAGAAALVAKGAQAGGAGLVRVCTPSAVRDTVAGLVPEALTVELPNHAGDAAGAASAACADADAVAVGPGLGTSEGARGLVHAILERVAVPTVLDADGLNACVDDPDRLRDRAASQLVLTPHAGELGRLTGLGSRSVVADRLAVAVDHAARWGATVVAKGPATVVAASDGRTWVTPTGSAALATGGTGDVLTGMVAAGLAQETSRGTGEAAAATARDGCASGPADHESVTAAAVWLHGRAGELAAAAADARSVTAGDVARAVADALRELADRR